MNVTINFRPLEDETLQLLVDVFEAHENDPAKTYARLMSAAMVASAILGLTPEQIKQQAEEMSAIATNAVAARTDIFGDFGGT